MILVDSNIWIDAARGTPSPEVALLKRAVEQDQVAVAPIVLQEVLQGFKHDSDYRKWHDALMALHPAGIDDPVRDALTAATLYRRCRAKGITLASWADCLIAAISINESLPLLTRDGDFDHLRSVEPMLVTVRLG